MKRLFVIAAAAILSAAPTFAQKFSTRTAKISFDATAPGSPEDITAVNNEVASILDAKTGDVVFQAPIKSFKFKRALMQEHFNENYLESDTYPKSDFRGTIANVSSVNFSKDGTYETKVSGKLTMHGVTKEVTVPGTIVVKGASVIMKATFNVLLADYKVNVPGVVSDKVGKEAKVQLEATLAQK
ncbi:MAG: YceI family protein [Taibaiella sp.]|nr:YceI family protein [Taibaiella sp.]